MGHIGTPDFSSLVDYVSMVNMTHHGDIVDYKLEKSGVPMWPIKLLRSDLGAAEFDFRILHRGIHSILVINL
jgi:hypothetical protein